MKVLVIKAVVASVALCLSGVAAAGKVIVLIESWRAEDQGCTVHTNNGNRITCTDKPGSLSIQKVI